MLEVYFDESGIEESARICVVAGYCAGQLDWRKCETRWRRVLDKEGIEAFHSKEFWGRHKGNRVKPYEGWTDERADKFLERLVCAIEQYGLMPIAHGIVVADWNQLSVENRRYFTGGKPFKAGSGSPNKPYYLPFQHCLIDAKNACGSPQDKVHYYFGLDRTFYKYAAKFFGELKVFPLLQGREVMGDISAPHYKDTPGLQAADLLAYRTYQYNLKRIGSGEYFDPLLKRLIRHKRPRQRFDLLRTPDFSRILSNAEALYQSFRSEGLIKHGKERLQRN